MSFVVRCRRGWLRALYTDSRAIEIPYLIPQGLNYPGRFFSESGGGARTETRWSLVSSFKSTILEDSDVHKPLDCCPDRDCLHPAADRAGSYRYGLRTDSDPTDIREPDFA